MVFAKGSKMLVLLIHIKTSSLKINEELLQKQDQIDFLGMFP